MRRSLASIVVVAMVVLGGATSGSAARPLGRFEASGPASVLGPAEVIYSNFGPDMAFDTRNGWAINGYQGPNIARQAISQQFTPAGDYIFRNTQIAVDLYPGPNSLHVYLQADSYGLPGAVMEDITIGGLGPALAVVTATSALSPTLYKDKPYWLTLVAVDSNVQAGWNWNLGGDVSATTIAFTQGGSAAGPWHLGVFATRGAFQINGTPATPEPQPTSTPPTPSPQPTSTPPTPSPQPTSTPPTPAPQSAIYLPLAMGPPYYRIAFSAGGIWVMNADGSNQTYLTDGANPAWSPDGRRIAFDGVDVINANGSNRSFLHSGGDPDWSPDGSRIAFVDKGDIYTMRADGSNVVAITKSKYHQNMSPDWSPNGSWIAYVYGDELYYHGYDVCLKPTNGTTTMRDLTKPLSDGDEYSPVWSPDGRWLAFTSSFPFNAGGSIWVVHPDGTNLTWLAAGGGPPAWSPDGRRIAFVRGGSIYVINIDGSGLTNLTKTSGYNDSPAWSPDGHWIAFVRGGSIYLMNADGSNQTYLAGGTDPVWSPTVN